ncbi:MAG: site-2 protease family protein [Acidimicrobiia bacterium]|nr:site-2 protease family protein [Acidimicrobiia bacterium]
MLRFQLFGIPVGVHVTFLLIVVLGPRDSIQSMVSWIVAAFVAIMLHEFGHALTARAFGAEGVNVTLYALGGLTSYTSKRKLSHGRSFIISAAGSGVGIIVGLALVGLERLDLFATWPAEVVNFLGYFVFVALVWGVLNWIPILPLDGGHMAQHLIAIFSEEWAPLIAQILTWIAVAIIVPVALINGYTFAAVIVVVFAFMGYREYQKQKKTPMTDDRRPTTDPEVPRPAPPAPPTPPPPPTEPPVFPI